MSQMNPKEFVHNTAYSIQLPYIAGMSLYLLYNIKYRNIVLMSSFYSTVYTLNNFRFQPINDAKQSIIFKYRIMILFESRKIFATVMTVIPVIKLDS